MKKTSLLLTVFFIVIYTVKGALVLDPDMGWHIQSGKYILQHGSVPVTDPFSYTMTAFPFVDHSWLMSVICAALYPVVGRWGLALMFGVTGALAFYTAHKTTRHKNIIPLFFSMYTGLAFIGIRSQIATWLLFAVLLAILTGPNKKHLYFIPPLMLLWVNLHGGFVIGICAVFFFVFTHVFTGKTPPRELLVVCAASIVLSFCNPYGVGIWREVYLTLTSTNLHFSIKEWQPAVFFLHVPFWVYAAFTIALVIKFFKATKNYYIFLLSAFLFVSALFGVRNIPLWLMTSFYLWDWYEEALVQAVGTKKEDRNRFEKAKRVFIIFTILISLFQAAFFVRDISASTEGKAYPNKAVEWLKKHPSSGNYFYPYSWGGYMIWKLPEKKTFIDGRMPIWRWSQNNPDNLNFPYMDYLKIMNGDFSIGYFVRKFHITRLVLPTIKQPSQDSFISVVRNLLGIRQQKKTQFPYKHILYQDEVATVYSTEGN